MNVAIKDILNNNSLSNREWVGIVEDADDPKHEFRAKVRIFGLFDDIDIEDLPWAYPISNIEFAGDGCGNISVPKVGTIVNIKFDNDNIYAPKYYSVENIQQEIIDGIKDSYENAHIYSYDIDENIKIYYTQKDGFIINIKNNTITIDNDDNIKIENNNGNIIEITNDGKCNINVKNDINIKGDKIIIDSEDINIGGDDLIKHLVKGEDLIKALNIIIGLINSHVHTISGSATIPISTPISNINNDILSDIIKVK